MTHPLAAYRREKNITRTQMAHLIGCDVSYVGHIEEGRRRPSPEMARRIEQATGGEVSAMSVLFHESSTVTQGKKAPGGPR